MLGIERTEKIVKQVLDRASKADQAEVLVFGGEANMTRFASNYIHQHAAERDGRVSLRVAFGKRIGCASANVLSDAGLQKLVERAMTVAKLAEEDPDFGDLPEKSQYAVADAYRPSTMLASHERRAAAVADLIGRAKAKGLVASGTFSTGLRETGIGNSRGVWAYQPVTVAEFSTTIMSDDSSGFAEASAIDVNDLDPAALSAEAIDKAERSRHPVELAPGNYPVVLEEMAVATLVDFLCMMGFNGLAVREGRSFLAELAGKKVVDKHVSLWDDGLDPRGKPMPFDFEGFPKKRVELITAGVAKNAVWDNYNARLAKVENTGHALPAPNAYGAIPLNVFMAPGATPREDLIKGIKKGVYVTRFHYTNPLDPKKTLITGMTRDGTFLIENGQVTKGLKNFRFTQEILGALAHVDAIARETRTFISSYGATQVPAVRLSKFNFSGVTEF